MRISWKTLMAMMCYALGVFGWIYIGGWMILTKPLRGLLLAQLSGELSIGRIVAALIQGFIYLSLAGGVWCVGYILSNYFKEN